MLKQDYLKKKDFIQQKIKEMPILCKEINKIITILAKSEIREPSLKNKIKDQIKKSQREVYS